MVNVNKILKLAREGYLEALEDFHYPPISEPEIVYEPEKPNGFWIDTEKWKVHLNAAEIPYPVRGDEEIKFFFRLISRHEIGHYIISPVDSSTSVKMIIEARKAVRIPRYDVLIANIVADIINDVKRSEIYGCYPILLDLLILADIKRKRLHEIEIGSFDYISLAVIVGVKELLWNKRIKAKNCIDVLGKLKPYFEEDLIKRNRLDLIGSLGLEVDIELRSDIEKIAKIIERSGIDNLAKMPQKTRKVAEILKKYIKEKRVNESTVDLISQLVKGDAERVIVDPNDLNDEETVVLIIEQVSKDSNSPQDAIEALDIVKGELIKKRGSKAGLDEGKLTVLDALRYWYRVNSRKIAKIIIRSIQPRGLIPSYPTKWDIGDPVEELDIYTTLSTLPVVVPSITTKKWVKTQVFGSIKEEIVPDLVIVIDSSGSMGGIPAMGGGNTNEPYHIALIGAFAAIHLAWRKGAFMSVINFSSSSIVCNWTRNIREVEDTLLKYQGGGTTFPAREFKKVIKKHKKIRGNVPMIALIITDAEIYNWEETEKVILNILNDGGTVALIYIYAGEPEKKLERIRKKGAKIFQVKKIKDLARIIIDTVEERYRTQ